MARAKFGGRPGDQVVSLMAIGSRRVLSQPVDSNGDPTSVTLTVWDAPDGNQITDLLAADGTTPISSVTVPANGQVPEFYGPDAVAEVYVKDPDGDFYRLEVGPAGPAGPPGAPGGSDAATAEHIESGPLTTAALNASIAQGIEDADLIAQPASPDDGDALVWDAGTSAWVPGTAGVDEETIETVAQAQVVNWAVADQVDFVELIRANSPRFSDVTFVKTATNTYQVRLHDGIDKGVTYQFIKDTNDDFIKIDGCYVGFGHSVTDFFDPQTSDLTGTWNTATSSWYTTEVGATFTGTVTGTRVDLRLIKESRGGLWHATIDGGDPIPVSCYNATTTGAQLVTLATGLTNTEHTVVLTFQGDDPENTPSGTARGYVRDDPAGTLVGYVEGAATTTLVLADGSNKEMAFDPTGGDWIPDHGVGTAFNVNPPVFFIDGEQVDVAGMSVGASQEVTRVFEMRQHFKGKNGSTDVIECRTTHTVDVDGLLSFNGRFEVLAATTMLGYAMMLPGWNAVTDTFVTGALTEHVNTGNDADFTYFADERDAVFSGAVVSSTNSDVIGAVTMVNPRLAYRRPATTGKPPADQALFVWNRATKPKMYWQSMAQHNMSPGDAYTWGSRFMVGEIEGARNLVLP